MDRDAQRKAWLSTLWIFVSLDFAFGDIFTLMAPTELRAILVGKAGGLEITPMFLLQSAIYVQVAILMVVLARMLPRQANRWSNLVMASLNILAVGASLFVGTAPAPQYLFFSIMEILALIAVIRLAWSWSAEPVAG